MIQNYLSSVRSSNYVNDIRELQANTPPQVTVRTYTEAKDTDSKIHEYMGKLFVVPATTKSVGKSLREKFIKEISRNHYAAKRICVLVNGKRIDAILMGKQENLNNGRWILQSNPNFISHEEMINTWNEIDHRIQNLNTNYLFFNYPGVASSEGVPNQEDMVAAYHAMLQVLEEDVQAKEIIGWGTSIGGGVQGEALKTHQFRKDIAYVFVKDQTFSAIQKVPIELLQEINRSSGIPELESYIPLAALESFAKTIFKLGGWTLDSVSSSYRLDTLNIPEIIIQNAKNETPHSKKDIVGDGFISARAALATALIGEEWKHKTFIGIKTKHTGSIPDEEEKRIDQAILQSLQETKAEKGLNQPKTSA